MIWRMCYTFNRRYGKMSDQSGFDSWMARVDAVLGKRCGLSSEDLPDMCYSDMYEDGVSPARAAGRAYRNAGGEV
jgi:hypothetical protein